MLEILRQKLFMLHQELVKNGLVAWSSGNISLRDPDTNLIIIKPSGIKYEQLTPQAMVILNLQGDVIEGKFKPSVDTATHLFIYTNRQKINGIVHTHSPYATAFAAIGQSIPACLTEIADEFGGPIPCGNYAPVGDNAIGKELLNCLGNSSSALIKHHGVFTIGTSPEKALKAAIMTEQAAKKVYLAKQLGLIEELPKEEILRANKRYIQKYGQLIKK